MITLFSWGYWGWGNATEQLVESADLAEKKRGFKPPVFVDIRRKRQGRAKGFVGDAWRQAGELCEYCLRSDDGTDNGFRLHLIASAGHPVSSAHRHED
jgi:hypothetical protein